MKNLKSWRQGASLLGVAVLAAACGGSSSETTPTGAAATTTGNSAGSGSGGSGSSSSSTSAGSGGSSGTDATTAATSSSAAATTSTSSTGAGGAGGATGAGTGAGGTGAGTGGAGAGAGGAGTGGTGAGTGGTGAGGSGTGTCPAQASFTLSVHVSIDVSWPATLGATAGTGKVHIWNKTKLASNGLMLAGDETVSCGTIIPPFKLGLGVILTGGADTVQIEIPNAIWDKPTMPKFHSQGVISGWDPGSTVKFEPTVGLVGLSMAMPMAAWPAAGTMVMPVDHDGDVKAGITAVPKGGGTFALPPTGLGTSPADQVYLATRTVIALDGKILAGCNDISGPATIPFFDNHVVGCHTMAGAECDANQIKFVDDNRTKYTVTGATFLAKKVPDNATCTEVRAALP